MKNRALGSRGLVASEIGLGCMNLSMSYGGVADKIDPASLFERAVDLDVTLFDTAELYGPYTNEELVGRALRAVRERVVISTKFGFTIPADGGRPTGTDSRPEHIKAVCDASLRRLGIDTIDLFYQHRVDPKVPIEDVAGTVGELVAAGKVRHFGLCEAGTETIRRAHAVFPVSALQTEYSLWSRDAETEVLPLCRDLGIGFVAYSPLGRGFLADGANSVGETDYRRSLPRWQGDALAHNRKLFSRLMEIANAKGCTPAQLALAWLLHQGQNLFAIPGTTKRHRLEENVAAAELTLDDAELAAINAVLPAGAAKGERYDRAGAALLSR